ncbi:MAG: class I SAM-dependent methyltransferase [Bacillota bacterium]
MNKGRLYDAFLWPLEAALLRRWRRRLWSEVRGPRVLELGSGTGLNFPYHPEGISVTALEKESDYLTRSRKRQSSGGAKVTFVSGSVEDLPFTDDTFDELVASFILCSVERPQVALREAHRVLKPGGTLRIMEHCRPGGILGNLFDWAAPWIHETFGDRIDGEPVPLLEDAGFRVVSVTHTAGRTLRLLVARK